MATNTTITFSISGASDSITIEADSTLNVDSAGRAKSSFSYGEKAYFRVYADDLTNIAVSATAGTIADHGIQQADKDAENIQFVDSQEYSYSYPIQSVVSYEWFGQNLGRVEKSGTASIKCETAPNATGGIIGLASVKVSAQYRLYSITLPTQAKSEFPVLIDVRTTT